MGLSDYVNPDEDTPEGRAFRVEEAGRDEVAEVLHRASHEGLLTTFASLTHRIHAATRAKNAESELNFRVQRNHVQAEILRRMRGRRL